MKKQSIAIFSSVILLFILALISPAFLPGILSFQLDDVPHGAPVHRFLTTTGDIFGERLATGNYITETTVFFIQPPSNTTIKLREMYITIRCPDGPLIFSNYCNSPPLTNGISFGVKSNTIPDNMLDDTFFIKSNGDWARACFEVELYDFGPIAGPMSDDSYVTVKCIFGSPLVLNGAKGEAFVVELNDNFEDFVAHTFFVIGGVE